MNAVLSFSIESTLFANFINLGNLSIKNHSRKFIREVIVTRAASTASTASTARLKWYSGLQDSKANIERNKVSSFLKFFSLKSSLWDLVFNMLIPC